MALTCSNCGSEFELDDEIRRRFAGKYFACPECGQSRRLPLIVSDSESPNVAGPLPKLSRINRTTPFPKTDFDSQGNVWWPKTGVSLVTKIWVACWLLVCLGLVNGPRSTSIDLMENALICAIDTTFITVPPYLFLISILVTVGWSTSRPDLPLPKKGMIVATGCWVFLGLLLMECRAILFFFHNRLSNRVVVELENVSSMIDARLIAFTKGIFFGVVSSTMIYFSVMMVLFVLWFATKRDDTRKA